MICVVCRVAPVPRERECRGYATCLSCGDVLAARETEAKSGRIAQAYSKGGYVYMGDEDAARKLALSVGRKDSAVEAPSTPDVAPRRVLRRRTRRARVGMYVSRAGDRCVLFEGDAPPTSARRVVWFNS